MALEILNMILRKICQVIQGHIQTLTCSKRLYGTRRQVLSKLAILVGFTICLTYYFMPRYKLLSLNETHSIVQNRLKEAIQEEKGTGCNRPVLDPFSAEVMKFNEVLPKIVCEGTDWVNCHKSECYVIDEILENMTDVTCIYRDILYVNDEIYFLSDYTKIKGNEKYSLKSSDFVKISCTGRELNSHSILASRWHGIKAGFRPVPTRPVPPDRKDSYNVLIVAFDSTSHNGFIRKMPKSYKYLKDKAVILNSINIVGDGTPPALFAILSGKAEDEHPDARKDFSRKIYVDDRLFIFHFLKKYGYRTAYFEDSPWIGTFQYRFNGFRRQPADHYLRPFFMEKWNNFLSFVNKHTSSNFNHCIGAVPQYKLMLDISNEFLQLDGHKFCFTMIADICHNDFNLITEADEPLVSFLETLDARGTFENTLVIVMGDHGFRFGKFRQTYQGKVEERLPLMAIILPEKLKKLRPNAFIALKQNRDVLTTHFDLHATILDVLNLKSASNKYRVPGSDLPRAMSLLEPIPKTRSCSEAGIIQHWCVCTKWFNVSKSDPMYEQVANVLAEYIDGICEEQRSKCEKRKLISIEWVLQQNVNSQVLKYGFSKRIDMYLGNPKNPAPRASKEYYQAKIILSPGRGVFEGTMMYNTQADSYRITEKDISRVSAYGDEPKCISATHPHLDKYCYCKDRLQSSTNQTTDS